MNSLILQTVARALEPIMLLYGFFLLSTGHHQPGGGFAGGLAAAGAFVLHMIAFGPATAPRLLVLAPHTLVGLGLLLALTSGLPALLGGEPFLASRWVELPLPGLGPVKLGTPLLFDLGVFLLVVGITAMIVTSLTRMHYREMEGTPPAGDLPAAGAEEKR